MNNSINQKFLAGVIGLGIGERHIQDYHSDERCRVKTICDIDIKKLIEVGERYPNCIQTTDPYDVFNDPEIGIISIASFDNCHAIQICAAIKAGKHVFVEKPLCLTEEEFEMINRELLLHPHIYLSSNFVLRRYSLFQEIKSRVNKGQFGDVYHMEGEYNYGRIHKLTEGWRGDIPFYSVTHGGAIHIIDLVLWYINEKVDSVIATGNNISTKGTKFRHPDTVTALLRFENGKSAKVTANFGSCCPHHHALSMFGTKATFVYNHQGGIFYKSRDQKGEIEELNQKFEIQVKGDVLRTFISQILDNTSPAVKVEEVMDVMAVSLAIEKSLHTKIWEEVQYSPITKHNNKNSI